MTPSPRDRIERLLATAARRERNRRLVTGLTLLGLAYAVLGALVAAGHLIGPRIGAHVDLAGLATAARPVLALLPVLVVVAALLPGRERSGLARRLDRTGGLDDRVATASALLAGRTSAGLAEHVLADAARAVAAEPGLLDLAFPPRPHRAALRVLRGVAVLLVVLVLAAGLAALLPEWPGGGGPGGDPEDAALPPPSGVPGASEDPLQEPEERAADEPGPDEPERPDAAGPGADPETPEQPDDEARGPVAEVGLRVLGSPFRVGDHMLASVRAAPGEGLADDAALLLGFEVDGRELPTRERLALGPGRPDGAGRVLDLTDLPGAEAALEPGEHVAVAVLVHPDGRTARSAPVPFRVEADGDGGGGGGGGGAPPPQPEPPAEPDQPVPPEPPSAPEAGERGGEAPPPPEVAEPEVTDRNVVVPLFGDGETVRKTGPRLVLTPGGRPEHEDAPDPVALEAAVRRAEAAVARAALSPEDRVLVRRYLEGLRARFAAAREEESR